MALVPIGQDQVVEVKEPTREMFPGTLGGAVEFTIVHFVYKVLEVMGEGIGKFAGSFLVHFLESIEPTLIDYAGPLIEQMLQAPGLPTWFTTFLQKIKSGEHEAGAAILSGLASGSSSAGLLSMLEPVFLTLGNFAWNLAPIQEPDVATLLALKWRGGYSPEAAKERAQWQGFRGDLFDIIEDAARPRLAIGDMITLAWRDEVDMSSVRAEIVKRGYTGAEADDLLTVATQIPGPGDLISMAVREAFDPDIVAKYGYGQHFPDEFGEWMEKQGFDEHWARKYWTAHWRLPSVGQAFTMLHRGEIGMPEIRDLLRTADVAPSWHDPLIAIAYSPYTRVDVRRMHKLGILADDDLVKSYKDLGYDDEKASNMAMFTILYNIGSERDATKADILKGYRLGMFKRGPTITMLIDIGITEQWAEYYVDMEDIRIEEQRIEEEIKTVRLLFVDGEIVESEVHARLGLLGLAADRVARLIEQWNILRERKITRPTRSDLERFYELDIIEGPDFKRELDKRGYPDNYIEWYYTRLMIDVAEEAAKEEERAAKEAERIRLTEEKTAYQEARAEINYQIAELRVHWVEIRLTLERQMDAPERRDLMDVIEAAKLDVVRIETEVAEKRVSLEIEKAMLRELAIAPDMEETYDLIDTADLQIADLRTTIAELEAVKVEAKAALRRARPPSEILQQRRSVDAILTDIAAEKAEIARLKLVIAGAKSELAIEWTSEDIAELEEAMRVIRLRIQELETERARLALTP